VFLSAGALAVSSKVQKTGYGLKGKELAEVQLSPFLYEMPYHHRLSQQIT